MSERNIAALAAELRARTPSEHQLALLIGGVSLRLRTNSSELVQRLRSYFGTVAIDTEGAPAPDIELCALQGGVEEFPYAFKDWPREAGKVGKKEAFADFEDGRIVKKVRTGMHFLVGHRDLVAVGPCLDNDNQIVNFINSQYVSSKLHEGWQLCHAAGVAKGGRGMVIAARAGAGKSTLALHLISSGLDFVSNDRVLIRRTEEGPRMAGIPKMPRVNPGTLLNNEDLAGILPPERERELRKLDKQELWNLEEKYDVMIEQTFGPGRCVFNTEMIALLVLNWSSGSTAPTGFADVAVAERPDLMDLVMKSPGVFHRDPRGRAALADLTLRREPYLDELSNVRVIEATGYADFPRAVELCRKLILQ